MATIEDVMAMSDGTSRMLAKVTVQTDALVVRLSCIPKSLKQSEKAAGSFADWAISKFQEAGRASQVYEKILQGLSLSDQYVETTSRLALMNDGLRTTGQLQDQIYGAAMRTRSGYQALSDTVGNLGILASHAFEGNDEMISFAEQMTKQFKIGGASIQEQADGMAQLTEAMAAGRVMGEQFQTILGRAPMLAQALARHFGTSVEGLQELSNQGLITAADLKAALFSVADETNARFSELPLKWGELWTMGVSAAQKAFEPVWQALSAVAGSGAVQTLFDGLFPVLEKVAWLISGTIYNLIGLGEVIADNWSLIAPIVGGVMAVLGVKAAILAGSLLLAAKGFVISAASAVAYGAAAVAETAAIFGMIVAQNGLNAALAACPLTWIIYGIIALVTMIYFAVAVFNKWAGTSYSATGLIMGAFAVMGAFIYNVIAAIVNFLYNVFVVGIWNNFAMLANFVGNVFQNPLGAVVRLFGDMADGIFNILEGIAGAIDTVFGSKLSDVVKGWREKLKVNVDLWAGDRIEFVKKLDNQEVMERIDYDEAWNKGYDFGDKLGFGSISEEIDLSKIEKSGIETARNTKNINDAVEMSDEEMRKVRDMAERDYLRDYRNVEVKVDMSHMQNTMSNGVEVDEVVKKITDSLANAVNSGAEGVHI